MKFNKNLLILVLISLLGQQLLAKSIYDPKTSYVTPLTNINFQQQVDKIRQTTKYVSVVQYYRANDGFSQGFASEFDQWVNDYRGVFRIGAVDCDEEEVICKKQGITKFPTFRIYVPEPYPHIDITEDITIQKIQQKAGKELYGKLVTPISNTNIQSWLADSPSVPKVLLFTDKEKGIPMILKGLSVAFDGKLFFGIVRKSDEMLVERYKVKSFPQILVITAGSKKPDVYKGEVKFNPIFDFLNIYSQTFVPGGGNSQDTAASKQWLIDIVPELHQKSANDICLKTEQTLCVIHMGKGKPNDSVMQAFKDLNIAFERQIERGASYKFMWLDASVEEEYAKTLGYEGQDKVIVLNPGKRKRYVNHDEDISYAKIKNTLEKISGGDARFIRTTLPTQFAFRKEY